MNFIGSELGSHVMPGSKLIRRVLSELQIQSLKFEFNYAKYSLLPIIHTA